MKALIASAFALGLLSASAAGTTADAAKSGVVVKINTGHHRHHVCGGWGWHHHARYCRRWYWR